MIRSLLALVALPFLTAFTFSPMSQTIDLEAGRRGTQFMIENDSSTSMAVELTVRERIMNEKGEETLKETSEVSAFPPQVIVPPKEKRTIRVTYNAKDLPEREKNYRVIAEQLPLNVDKDAQKKGGIKMLMKYVAALYAGPSNTKSDVKLVSFSSKEKELLLEVENRGTRHQLLNNPKLKYSHGSSKDELSASDLTGLAGENVLAGQKRIFNIKTSKTIPKDAKVELKFEE